MLLQGSWQKNRVQGTRTIRNHTILAHFSKPVGRWAISLRSSLGGVGKTETLSCPGQNNILLTRHFPREMRWNAWRRERPWPFYDFLVFVSTFSAGADTDFPFQKSAACWREALLHCSEVLCSFYLVNVTSQPFSTHRGTNFQSIMENKTGFLLLVKGPVTCFLVASNCCCMGDW